MLREAVRRHRVGVSRNRARRNAIRPEARHRVWCRQSCILPPGNVGATRWVARQVQYTQDSRVGLRGAAVHDGGRAIYRDGIGAARHEPG